MSSVKGPDEAQNPSFEDLVAQYQGSVLRMCFLYLCDKTLAEDAVQETFVKVYRGLNDFHSQSSIKTWIMKIAIHTCYDMNHSGWFRHFDRRITPEMLPEAAAPDQTARSDSAVLLSGIQHTGNHGFAGCIPVNRHGTIETGKRQTSRITGKEGFRCVKLKKE